VTDAAEVLDAAIAARWVTSTTTWPTCRSATAWNAANLEATLRTAIVEGLGLKARSRLRAAAHRGLGGAISPPLFESMEILGKTSTLNRLAALLATLPP
jgi:glutamyl-tRNA synthetase